jgi:hypothetical protein
LIRRKPKGEKMRGDGRGLITPLNADLKEGKAKGRQDLVGDGARDAEQGRDPEVEDATDTWGWPVSGWERGKKKKLGRRGIHGPMGCCSGVDPAEEKEKRAGEW